MPRNSSGTVTLPTNDSSPAAPRNVIRSADFNELMTDITTELTDSLSRSGKGGMQANLNMGGFDLSNTASVYMKGGNNLSDLSNAATARANLDALAKVATNTYTQDSAGAALLINKDGSPLDYSTTRAGLVFQHRDTGSLSDLQQVPGAMFQFTTTGNGFVNAGAKYSGSIWWGLTATQKKSGDGSAHAFTAVGELLAVGAGGYNECGLFQGQATNIASTNGNLSGVEVLCSDGTSGTNFATQVKAVIGRVGRFNAGGNSWAFFASSEGTQRPDAVLAINPSSTTGWGTGIDLSAAVDFSTGMAVLVPNNTSISSQNAADTAAVSMIFLDATDRVQIAFGAQKTQFGSQAVVTNNTAFASRNAANNADIALISLDTSNRTQLGAASEVRVANRLTLTAAESSQLAWSLGGQEWRANMASGGNWYLFDATNTKFPLTVVPNAIAVNITTTGMTVAGTFGFNPATTTTAPAAGGAGALPATPLGYFTVTINGTDRKVAYYAA